MFRIECFCDDKNLARTMHALNGLVLNLNVAPVVNAIKANGTKLQAQTDGDAVSLLAQWLKQHGLKEVDSKHLRQFQRDVGRSEGGYSYTLRQAQGAKLLKKISNGHHSGYKVLPGKEA